MGNGKEKEHRSHRRDQSRASDDPLPNAAWQALRMGGHIPSPGPAEAQQLSSTPATSGHAIQQPRPAPYKQGQLGGNTSSGGGYPGTAQYSGSPTGEAQPLSGGYPASAYPQTREEHKRGRESSSSSGDHERSDRKDGGSKPKHKKADDGTGKHHHGRHHSSHRGESQGGGRSHHEPRPQPENQGPSLTPAAPQYQNQPSAWQNTTSWPTNAPATAGFSYGYGYGAGAGGGGGSAPQPAGAGGGYGRSYGDDMPIDRQSHLPAGLFPPGARGQYPPAQSDRPRLAPVPSIPPRQQRRLDQVPSMLPEPPHMIPMETQPQPRAVPPLQLESQRPGPMLAPVRTSAMGSMSGPAASRSDDSLDPFNVTWRDDTFDISQGPSKGMTAVQVREARVIIASFATWEEAGVLGQRLPRAASTLAQLLKRDDGSQWGLRQWREWTMEQDLVIWEHRAPPPTQDIEHVAARLQRDYLPERMLGEVVGRLKLFARIGVHPGQAGATIGGFPAFGLKEKVRARQGR